MQSSKRGTDLVEEARSLVGRVATLRSLLEDNMEGLCVSEDNEAAMEAFVAELGKVWTQGGYALKSLGEVMKSADKPASFVIVRRTRADRPSETMEAEIQEGDSQSPKKLRSHSPPPRNQESESPAADQARSPVGVLVLPEDEEATQLVEE